MTVGWEKKAAEHVLDEASRRAGGAMEESKTARHIRETGWSVIKVFDPDGRHEPFAFTVGLWRTFRHPELLMMGMPLDDVHLVLNTAGAEIRAGRRFSPGDTTPDFLEDFRCGFRPIEKSMYDEYLGSALSYYRDEEFEALQVLWPDSQDRLPGEAGCDHGAVTQQTMLAPS